MLKVTLSLKNMDGQNEKQVVFVDNQHFRKNKWEDDLDNALQKRFANLDSYEVDETHYDYFRLHKEDSNHITKYLSMNDYTFTLTPGETEKSCDYLYVPIDQYNEVKTILDEECSHRLMDRIRYESSYGPNTKQLWVYDNEQDAFIDPPKEVLDEIEKKFDLNTQNGLFEAENYLDNICNNEEPDWLEDEDYTYDEDLDI